MYNKLQYQDLFMGLFSKKLLISGGTGYLGAHLVNKIFLDFDITVLDRSIKNDRLNYEPKFVELDLSKNLDFNFSDFAIFVHTAYLKNLDAEKVFIEKIAKENPGVFFLFFSSAAVYGELEDSGYSCFDTNSNLNPINDYGRYKLELENFIKSNFENYLILRISNPYGKEFAAKGMHAFFKSKIDTEDEPIILNINAEREKQIIRDMIFIDDLVLQIDKAIKGGIKGVFNISSGKASTLEDFVEKINMEHKKIQFNYTGFNENEIKKSVLKPSL